MIHSSENSAYDSDSLSPRQKFIQNLPNYITLARLALVPLFVFLMLDPTPTTLMIAVVVFVTAAVTDYVDGLIARQFGAVSDFGKLLDPLVDKVLVMAALVMLVAQRSDVDGTPWVPGWMVVLVLARELWVTGLRAVAAGKGVIVAAKLSGKLKSGFQMVAVVLLLLHDQPMRIFGQHVTTQFVGLNLLFISILVSYWGAFEYTHLVLLEEREQRRLTENQIN